MSLMSVPEMIGGFLVDYTSSQFMLLMIIALVLILSGMFLESIAQIILFVPLMLPIVVSAGVDPIVFGILMVIACEIGFLTPPVGANLFVAARLTNLGIDKLSVAVLPFLFTYLLVIIIISLFPGIVLILPNAWQANQAKAHDLEAHARRFVQRQFLHVRAADIPIGQRARPHPQT